MDKKQLLEEHLKILFNDAKNSTRTGEELFAITQAIELTLRLITES